MLFLYNLKGIPYTIKFGGIRMQNDAVLSALSRDELEKLVSIYAKNWLALDGYWFQAVERKRGMDEAMEHDIAVWQGFTRTEARRIKALLKLPEQAGA